MTTDSDGPVEAPHVPKRVRRHSGLPFAGELQAIVRGIRATAREAAKAARDEARRADGEAWARYEALTKHRRDR